MPTDGPSTAERHPASAAAERQDDRPSFWRVAVAVSSGIWAVGMVLAEPLQQLGFALTAFAAFGLWRSRRTGLDVEVKRFVYISVALVSWQAVSPAVALLTGATSEWPRAHRYFQAFEPLGSSAVAVAGSVGLPWAALAAILGFGWLASIALAAFQHFVLWPFDLPKILKVSTERVRENFGTLQVPRYGAGGFYFHRLRFAHAAVALWGPAFAACANRKWRKSSLLPAALVVALPLGIYLSFARAALGALLLVAAVAVWALGGKKLRAAGLLALLALAGVALTSSGWKERLRRAEENVSGERGVAMAAGMEMFRRHPAFGVGFGNHRPHALPAVLAQGYGPHIAWDSHNLWVTTLAETGVVGGLLLLMFHASLARALWKRARGESWVAQGALLSWLGFHILSAVHYLPFHPSVALSFYFVWGLGLVHTQKQYAVAQT